MTILECEIAQSAYVAVGKVFTRTMSEPNVGGAAAVGQGQICQ